MDLMDNRPRTKHNASVIFDFPEPFGPTITFIEFSKGKRKFFSVNLHIKGSVLQKKIWKELRNIKYGKTKTYGDIAKILRTSPRYVGNVCGQNNHLLVVPCHRVVRSDGTLGGFSGLGGIKLKQKLLKLEQA